MTAEFFAVNADDQEEGNDTILLMVLGQLQAACAAFTTPLFNSLPCWTWSWESSGTRRWETGGKKEALGKAFQGSPCGHLFWIPLDQSGLPNTFSP